jgi:hypothetical protein
MQSRKYGIERSKTYHDEPFKAVVVVVGRIKITTITKHSNKNNMSYPEGAWETNLPNAVAHRDIRGIRQLCRTGRHGGSHQHHQTSPESL